MDFIGTIRDMFSSIGNLNASKPKEAERSDARLDIRRHDPEYERRKKDQEKEKSSALFNTEDSATVSIQALLVFLENFLVSLQAGKVSGANPAQQNAAPAPEQPAAKPESLTGDANKDGKAAQAASAYAHAYETGAGRAAIPGLPEENTPMPGIELPADDVRTIHRLITDLKELSAQRVEYLTIERDISFLQSLVSAVEKLKARL